MPLRTFCKAPQGGCCDFYETGHSWALLITLPLHKYLKAADGGDSCADFGGSSCASWWFFESLRIFTHALRGTMPPTLAFAGVRVPLGLAGLEENMKSVATRT